MATNNKSKSSKQKFKKKAPVLDKVGQSRPPPEDEEEFLGKRVTKPVEAETKAETTAPPTDKKHSDVEDSSDQILIVPSPTKEEQKPIQKIIDVSPIVASPYSSSPSSSSSSSSSVPAPIAPPSSLEEEEEEEEEKQGFPHSLGPFGIKQTTFKGTSFHTIMWGSTPNQGGMFFMEQKAFGHTENLRALSKYIREWPVVGQFSPVHPVTLTIVEKEAALIPRDATAFVWSYPVAIQLDPSKAKGIDFADPDIAFLTVGGYVYFNSKKTVCGVNTIIPATTGLQFSKPLKWDHDYTGFLNRDGRFQSITIKALNDCGAWYFAWIRPDEPLVNSWGVETKLCPNGGFVYLFHRKVFEGTEEEMAKDCYFHVLSGEEYKQQVEKHQRKLERQKSNSKKAPMSDKPGQKSAPPLDLDGDEDIRETYDDDDGKQHREEENMEASYAILPIGTMLGRLHELVDEKAKLLEHVNQKKLEQKEVHGGSPRKPVPFMEKPINTWTIDMVGVWLDSVEFHSYKDTFKKQMVDGETLLDLDEVTIRTLVQEFHIKKMLRLVDRLRMQQQASQAVRKAVENQQTLEDRIEELKSQIESVKTCVLCIDNDKNIKFNCGHVCACHLCAEKLTECPVCRSKITKRERVYLS